MHYREAYLLHGAGTNFRTWTGFFTLSFLCHLLLFGILILTPGYLPERDYLPEVINVTMVTLSDPTVPVTAEPARDPAAQTVPQPTGLKPRATDPAVTKKKRPKTSLKKKTFKSSKVVQSAIDRLEENIEDTRPDPLEKALERLKKEVGEAPPPSSVRTPTAAVEPRPGIVGGSRGGNRKIVELLDIYRVEIASRVRKHWAFSASLAGEQEGLVVYLAFNVLPDGTITDIWFDKRSGNRHLDESAKRAVMKSNPVGPHPESLSLPYVTVGLRFGPEGVK